MNDKQFELHMEMLDRIRCGLIDVEGKIAALKAEVKKFTSTNSVSPKCGECGSETVKVVCASCGKTGCYGTWSEPPHVRA